ncbi:MAG TPA: hypothetical protein DCF45_03430 [Gammaproteobacteria bacterium]|nr:hypothetical protein [Gammaproteobacteria bacterium]
MSKKSFDILVVILSSVVWLPVIVLASILIFFLDGRPVFYSSKRRAGEGVISVVKFRTMLKDVDKKYNRSVVSVSNNVRFLNTPPDSPFYTPIGRFIERCSLTEIPQFFLVLAGKMSVVGNRPLPVDVVQSLGEIHPDVEKRFASPGGMTGPVQLVGRQELTDQERLRIESKYCDFVNHRYRWFVDAKILLFTVLISARLMAPCTVQDVLDMLD